MNCMGFFYLRQKCYINASFVRPKESGKLSYWNQKAEVI